MSASHTWAQTGPAKKAQQLTPYELLQGVWATSKEENAVFWVRGSSLYYTDFQDTPVRYSITASKLTIYNEGTPSTSRIKKLTKDSLVYVNEFGFVGRMYKRK